VKKTIVAALAALLLPSFPVFAALPAAPPPGERTILDEIMREQSRINLRKGHSLMSSGDYAAAAAEFSRALAKAPSDPDAILLYGSSLYWLGEVDRAVSEYLRVIELDPENALAWQLKGIALAWKGDAEGALQDFLKAQKLDPVRSDVKMNIGSVYHSLGLYGSALEYFRAAAASDPENPLYHYQLGLLYSRLGRNAEAKASLRTALKYFRSYEDAILELAVLEERDGDLRSAIGLYRDALRIKPRDSVARLRLGLALLKQGGAADMARELEPAFMLSPKNEKGGISLSMSYAGGRKTAPSEGEAEGPLLSSLRRLPEDEEVRVRLELIRLPRLEKKSPSVESLAGALARAVERPRLSYVKKEYAIPAGAAGRAERLRETAEEIERLIASASAEGDVKVGLDIETVRPAAKTEARVVYEPRSVGNDMGLWVVGNNWLENVEEALAELEESARAAGGAAAMLRGLAFLRGGEHAGAAESFRAAPADWRPLALLGLCVAAVQEGNEAGALDLAGKALEAAPSSKVAKENLDWLERAGGKK
jgi:tetratricopeptide (TPR) repeat protein